MLDWLFSSDRKRKRLLDQVAEGPLRDYLQTPPPNPGASILEVPILAVDFETTGTDPENNLLLSVGCVTLQNEHIDLASAWHQIISSARDLHGDNVAIHQITDDEVQLGAPLSEVTARLLKQLQGKVLLAHNAQIETGFLNRACAQLYGAEPVVQVIDTLQLARKRAEQRQQHIKPGELRLFNLRAEYGLPDYKAHNALTDALATAELFLAHVAHGNFRTPPPLKYFLR